MKITTAIKHFSSPESKEMIQSFIQNHPQGVITTISSVGRLQGSVINVYELNNYHLAFMTRRTTRKFKNIQQNPTVSFVTYDSFSKTEAEVEGIAQLVHDEKQMQEILQTIDRDSKIGRWHTSPSVGPDDDFALFVIYPKKMHMTTYWDRGSGMEAFHESVEFTVKMKS